MPQIDLATGALHVEGLSEPLIPRMEYSALEALLGDRLRAVPTNYPKRNELSLYALLEDHHEPLELDFLLVVDALRGIGWNAPKESLTTLEGKQWVLPTFINNGPQKYAWGDISYRTARWSHTRQGKRLRFDDSKFNIWYFFHQHTP